MNESLIGSLIAHFAKKRFAQKTDERIPNPAVLEILCSGDCNESDNIPGGTDLVVWLLCR